MEIRFDTDVLPEVVFGRLADRPAWQGLQQRRLPAYEMPAQLRQMEPRLRYQPLLELYEAGDTPRALRMGPKVLAYHRTKRYVGWELFQPELEKAVDDLFDATRSPTIERLGLRYINALRNDVHGVAGIADLDLSASVAGDTLEGSVNLNFQVDVDADTRATIRVATPDFVQGSPLPENTTVYVDIDVFTKPEIVIATAHAVKQWILGAHTAEKVEFFHLLRQPTIDALRET